MVVVEEDGSWNEALFVRRVTNGEGVSCARLLLADGSVLVAPGATVRSRAGEGHPMHQVDLQ